MPDMLTIRDTVKRAEAEGMPISEYTLRIWVKAGEIPCRKAGRTALLFWPNVKRYLTCDGGKDGT